MPGLLSAQHIGHLRAFLAGLVKSDYQVQSALHVAVGLPLTREESTLLYVLSHTTHINLHINKSTEASSDRERLALTAQPNGRFIKALAASRSTDIDALSRAGVVWRPCDQEAAGCDRGAAWHYAPVCANTYAHARQRYPRHQHLTKGIHRTASE